MLYPFHVICSIEATPKWTRGDEGGRQTMGETPEKRWLVNQVNRFINGGLRPNNGKLWDRDEAEKPPEKVSRH